MSEQHPQAAAPEHSTSRLVPVIGAFGVIMIAAGVLIGAVRALGPASVTAEAPSLVVIAPAAGDTVATPIELRFIAGDDLALGSMGWASGALHLHAWVDGREVMPTAADIRALEDGTFVWTLPLAPGNRIVQLRWAGMDHSDIEAGSRAVGVVVR